MSLTDALISSGLSLKTLGIQSSVVSRNVAGANQSDYSRKIAELATMAGTGVYVQGIQRAASNGLFKNVLVANSASASQTALNDGLQKLAATVNDPQNDQSPAALLGQLRDALQQYATAPDNITLAQAAVTSASNMVTTLNDATNTVQSVREQADADMATSVGNINQLLTQFQTVNAEIVKGTITGSDITDYQDQRDSILTKLSQEIGITTATRANGDMAIYTDSGVVLFDQTARSVTFTPQLAYSATTTGNAVVIDGVPVTGAGAVMPIQSGKLAGLATLRDKSAVTYQEQLDEIARGLVEAFAESDQAGPGPNLQGLFTYPSIPPGTIPPTGTIVPGIAGTIAVNPNVDPTANPPGNATLLRDGAICGNAAYNYNTTGDAGFSARLQQLISNMDASRAYDPTAQASPNGSLVTFAGSSSAWISSQEQASSNQLTYQNTLLDQSNTALSNTTGVNMDDETAFMMQIERTYSASAKLIATVDTMLQSLLAAVTVTPTA